MTLHHCSKNWPHDGYGSAIDDCREQDGGTLWAGNDEYGTQVLFCPFCGYRAKVEPVEVETK